MRRLRRKPPPLPVQILDRIAQGEGGERQLQDWLDRSNLHYLYVHQAMATMPLAGRGQIKRPDFITAIPGHPPVAIDAKAKSFFGGQFLLNEYERRALSAFEALFQMPVWYACFPPEEPLTCILFRNSALHGQGVSYRPASATLQIPLSLGLTVQHHAMSFSKAIISTDVML